MADFEIAHSKTAVKEGGYVNNEKDPGGETNHGITKYVAMRYGYTGDMKTLPVETAKAIYKKAYWDTLYLDSVVDQDVASEIFDTGVNCGIGTSAGFVQKILNAFNKEGTLWNDLKEDGVLGMASISALNRAIDLKFKPEILKALNSLQGAHYIDIARRNTKLEVFVLGWFRNRVG